MKMKFKCRHSPKKKKSSQNMMHLIKITFTIEENQKIQENS